MSKPQSVSHTTISGQPHMTRIAADRTVVAIFNMGVGYDRILMAAHAHVIERRGTVFTYYDPMDQFWEWKRTIHVDGVLGRFLTRTDLAPFLKAGMKVVTWVPPHEPLGIPVVASDDVAIGAMVARYFMERGFRQFAFVNVPASWSHKRHEGFRQILDVAGYTCQTIEYDPWPKDAHARVLSQRAFERTLAKLPCSTGVMAANDATAIQVMQYAGRAGRSIPADLAVVGVDDDPVICLHSGFPTISSVVQDYKQIQQTAFDILWRMLDGKAPPCEPVLIPPLMVRTRASSDISMSGDPHLAKALAFVHAHAHENIGIEQIARQAGVSDQLLRRKFKASLHRSPHEELIRRRVAMAQELLLQGEENIQQIAELSGFGSLQRFYIAFRRVAQMSPKQYKAKFKHDQSLGQTAEIPAKSFGGQNYLKPTTKL